MSKHNPIVEEETKELPNNSKSIKLIKHRIQALADDNEKTCCLVVAVNREIINQWYWASCYYLVRSKSVGSFVVRLTRLLSKVVIIFSAHSRNFLSFSDVTEDTGSHINTATLCSSIKSLHSPCLRISWEAALSSVPQDRYNSHVSPNVLQFTIAHILKTQLSL